MKYTVDGLLFIYFAEVWYWLIWKRDLAIAYFAVICLYQTGHTNCHLELEKLQKPLDKIQIFHKAWQQEHSFFLLPHATHHAVLQTLQLHSKYTPTTYYPQLNSANKIKNHALHCSNSLSHPISMDSNQLNLDPLIKSSMYYNFLSCFDPRFHLLDDSKSNLFPPFENTTYFRWNIPPEWDSNYVMMLSNCQQMKILSIILFNETFPTYRL